MAPDDLLRGDNVAPLQAVINRLSVSWVVLARRRRGDPGAVQDFLQGQFAILSALDFLATSPTVTEAAMARIIEAIWRRYRLGPTLGNGMACLCMLMVLHKRFGSDPGLEWPDLDKCQW